MGDAERAGDITLLLREWREGDAQAFERLVPAAYSSLHSIAHGYLRADRPGHTLQATALVNELFLRLVRQRQANWNDRAHFFTFAAKLMRMILIDYSRANRAQKRGGDALKVPLSPELPWFVPTDANLLDLNRALEELEELDPNKVRLVEIRCLLGCSAEESAEMLGTSKSTVDREMKFIRSWLYARLKGGGQGTIPSLSSGQ